MKEERKQRNSGPHDLSVLLRYPQKTQVKDWKDRKILEQW